MNRTLFSAAVALLASPALAFAQVPVAVDQHVPAGPAEVIQGFTLPLAGAAVPQTNTYIAVLAVQPDTTLSPTAATYQLSVNGSPYVSVPMFGASPASVGSPPAATLQFDEPVANGVSIIRITHLPPISAPQAWNLKIQLAAAAPATCFSGQIHHVEATAKLPRISLITPGTPPVFRSDNHCNGITGTPLLSTASVDFGVVTATTTKNLDLQIFNSGTEALDPASITLPAPFAFGPNDPASIAPNAVVTLTIPYSPVAVGANMTTLNVSDAAAVPATVAVPLTGSGIFRDLVLCLDGSNSMNWRNDGTSIIDCATLTGGGALGATFDSESRIRNLRIALNSFHAKMQSYGDKQARLAFVQFPGQDLVEGCAGTHANAVASAVGTWTKNPVAWQLQLYDTAASPAWTAKFDEASYRGWWHSTPMLRGLEVSSGLLTASGTHKGIILLGDGAHNVPTALTLGDWDTQAAALLAAGIRVYTIGFGTTASVDHDALSHLAAGTAAADPSTTVGFTGHRVYAPGEDPLLLRKYYDAILGDVFDLQGIADPIETINWNQTKTHKVPVTGRDHRVTFAIGWRSASPKHMKFELIAPDNTRIGPASPRARFFADDHQMLYTVDPGLRTRAPFVGEWTLELTYGAGDQERGLPPVTYSWDVLSRSDLEMNVKFGKPRYHTGDKLFVTASLSDRGFGMRGQKVLIDIQRPGEGYGDWMAKSPVSLEALEQAVGSFYAHTTENITGVVKKYHYITQILKKPFPPFVAAGTGVEMKDDGTGGDVRAGDGVYTASFDALLTVPGAYHFRVLGTGKTGDGQAFRREQEMQQWVEVRVDTALTQTQLVVEPIASGKEGFERFRAFVEPRDRQGNRLGPGYAKDVVIESARARALTAEVIEDLNGGYFREFEYDARGGAPIVEVSIKGEKLPPRIGPVGTGGGTGSNVVLWLVLLLILLAIALIIALLRCCRKA